METPFVRRWRAPEAARIPAERIYLLGDNAEDSLDSRHYGPIPTASVVGVVSYVLWSPQRRRADFVPEPFELRRSAR